MVKNNNVTTWQHHLEGRPTQTISRRHNCSVCLRLLGNRLRYGYSCDPGANRTSALRIISQRISIAGTVTVGDVISHNVTYTTVTGDTTTSTRRA
ncbi:MAG TPA: hypothetical protein V6C81_31630 [Planktothrix sp.]